MDVSRRQWLRILAVLQAKTGTDFAGYGFATLQRRLQHHVASTECRSMAAYLRLLEHDPREPALLHAAFLVKVSSFFRGPASWAALARRIGHLAEPGQPLRAWSAGCATGEEAYSLALLLSRVLGTSASARWTVFATDLDEGALKVGRAGRYSDEQVRPIPADDLERHFVRDGGAWRIGSALRKRVVFGKHDLLRDPPLARMDLVACCNVLVYFKAAARRRALANLSLALNPRGLLLLGPADAHGALPLFRRVAGTMLFRRTPLGAGMPAPRDAIVPGLAALGGLVEESSSVLAIAIDGHGKVVSWNRAAEDFFGKVAGQAIGQALPKAVGIQAAHQLQAAIRAGTPGGHLLRLDREGSDAPRALTVECLRGSAMVLLLAAPVAQAGAAPVLHYPGHPMVKSGPRQRPSGVHARPPKDLAEELRWRSDELETVNEELTSINDELSAAERAAQGAARRAQRSDRLLRQTLDTAARPFILCNPDNRIVLWNRAAARRYGLSAVQAVGKELFALLPGLDHRALRKACLKARTAEGARPESVTQGGERYLVDPFPGLASGRRHYLLRVGST